MLAVSESEQIIEELVELWRREYPEQSPDFPRFYKWTSRRMPISKIHHNAPDNQEKAYAYAQKIAEGRKFPPLVVLFMGGQYQLIDGYHRMWAQKECGATEVVAYVGSIL